MNSILYDVHFYALVGISEWKSD